jgi:hypothetical protein
MHPLVRLLSVVLTLVALGLLYPGVTKPVLTLSGEIEKSRLAELGIDLIAGEDADSQSRQVLTMLSSFLGLDRLEGTEKVYETTRSIWSMAEELAKGGNLLVAGLIITFSVVVPTLKLSLQFACVLLPERWVRAVLPVNAALSKWSMADVFVMALLVAYMAGRAAGHMGDTLQMHAQLEVGFYYFLGYCLFAIVAGMLLTRVATAPQRAP